MINLDHFTLAEFFCPCCGAVAMDDRFLGMLDAARGMAGVPFEVTSGYRCASHNAIIGGVAGSAHLAGMAADIAARGDRLREKVLFALISAGFRRIGISRTFIHVDCDRGKANAVWLY